MAGGHRRRRDRRPRGRLRDPVAVVDGNDLWAVHEAAREAVDRARAGGGPTLLECRTYRHYGHSKSDPATYRPEGEVERWLAARPAAARPRAPARRRGSPRSEIAAASEAHGRASCERAVEAALAAPYPDPARTRRRTEFRGMSELEFRDAIRDALAEELERDRAVVFFGEDVAAAGGVFAVTAGPAGALRRRPRLRHADLRARARRRRLRRRR